MMMRMMRLMLLASAVEPNQVGQDLPVNRSRAFSYNNNEDDSEKRLLPFAKSTSNNQPERMQVFSSNHNKIPIQRRNSLVFIFIIQCLVLVFFRFAFERGGRKRLRSLSRCKKKESKQISHVQQSIAKPSRKSMVIILTLCKLLLLLAVPLRASEASALQVDDSLDPQPLIYLPAREIGSGVGPISSANAAAWPAPEQSMSSSSPALITAKCWNNYQTDEDCRHIQVITANQGAGDGFVTSDGNTDPDSSSSPSKYNQQLDDDSLISPVLLFESSSTQEPSNSLFHAAVGNSQSAFLAPPYFSAPTERKPLRHPNKNTNNQNINIGDLDEQQAGNNDPHHHHLHHHNQRLSTPPTANDLFAVPPAGATLLPPTTYFGGSAAGSGSRLHSMGGGFVGTPRPKKPPKSTTAGRKCRDENDADCDEPDDENNDDEEDDAGDGDGAEDNIDADLSRQPAHSSTYEEFGSGGGPEDDSEGDDDDLELESSGSGAFYDQSTISANSHHEQTSQNNRSSVSFDNGQFVHITSVASPVTPTPSNSPAEESANPASAEIEVVVHSTLPASFPSSTFPPSPSWRVPGQDNDEETQVSSSYGSSAGFPSSSTTTTTTTAMPDDTFKSKPVFPPSSPASDLGGAGDTDATTQTNVYDSDNNNNNIKQPGDNESQQSMQTTESIDLATFKPVPMPAVNPELQQPRRLPADSYLNTFRSPGADSTSQVAGANKLESNGAAGGERTDTEEDHNRLADRHRLDFNTPLPELSQPGTPSPQQQPAPPAVRPFESPWREKSWRGSQSSPGELLSGRPVKSDETDSAARRLLLSPQVSSSQQQTEMLPTLLLYASIIILVVTASIFVIMAFAFWRRNSIRQQALLSSKSVLLNGNGPIGGFATGGVNYLANQHHLLETGTQVNQQPGLLSTYAPGKGLSSKLTSSLMKEAQEIAAEDEEDQEDDEQEEEEEEEEEDEDDEEDEEEEDSFNNQPKERQASSEYNRNHTQEQQRSTAQQSWTTEDNPTTSSAGSSQRTSESQQALGRDNHQVQRPVKRINQQLQQYPNSLSDGRQNSSSLSDSQSSPVDIIQGPQQPPMSAQHILPKSLQTPHYPLQTNNGQPTNGFVNHQYPAVISQQPQPIPYPDQYYPQPVNSHRQQLHNGFHASPGITSVKNYNSGVAFNSSRSVENLNNPSMNSIGPNYSNQYPVQALSNPQRGILAGFNHSAASNQGQPHRNHIYLPPEPTQAAFPSTDHHHPTRVTVNPLATMSRRQSNFINQPTPYRQIYSEDSSSFLTASPSLARTSSSSSFAFNVNQQMPRGNVFEQSEHPTAYQQRMARLV